jgi:GST-like protein
MHGQKLEDFPNVERWYNAIAERPGVKRGMKVPRKMETAWAEDKDAWSIMFDNQQYERR